MNIHVQNVFFFINESSSHVPKCGMRNTNTIKKKLRDSCCRSVGEGDNKSCRKQFGLFMKLFFLWLHFEACCYYSPVALKPKRSRPRRRARRIQGRKDEIVREIVDVFFQRFHAFDILN